MRRTCTRRILIATALVLMSALIARAQTVQRSLDEWLAAQGTFCYPDGAGGCAQFFSPLPNMLGWQDTEQNRCAVVDYAGLADQWLQDQSAGALTLGTTVTGTVTERPLWSGGAEIIVRLTISYALVFSVAGCDAESGPLEFGRRAQDVLAGDTPSLADATFYARYLASAPGLPLADLVQITFFHQPGEDLAEVRLKADSSGELRAAFGVPDGTPGHLKIKEKLIFDTASGMPMIKEEIDLSVVED